MKFLLDPGHGGQAFGFYPTPGKQSPEVPPGIYEGVYNRLVCAELAAENHRDFEILNIAPGPIRIPLAARVSFINGIVRKTGGEPCALISLHCNAAGEAGWNKAKGYTIFIERQASKKSERLAEIIHSHYAYNVDIKSRGIRRANFKIIKGARCPSVLLEMGFMTNKIEVVKLQDPDTVTDIVETVFESMIEYTKFVI